MRITSILLAVLLAATTAQAQNTEAEVRRSRQEPRKDHAQTRRDQELGHACDDHGLRVKDAKMLDAVEVDVKVNVERSMVNTP